MELWAWLQRRLKNPPLAPPFDPARLMFADADLAVILRAAGEADPPIDRRCPQREGSVPAGGIKQQGRPFGPAREPTQNASRVLTPRRRLLGQLLFWRRSGSGCTLVLSPCFGSVTRTPVALPPNSRRERRVPWDDTHNPTLTTT